MRLPKRRGPENEQNRIDRAVARIVARLRRLELGNPGDAKPVGSGLWEMRVDYGPGYRIYDVRRGALAVVLLCGGDKRTRRRDVGRAEALAAEKED